MIFRALRSINFAVVSCLIALCIWVSPTNAQYTFTKIADANTPVPGGGTFQFVYQPAAANGEISFKARLSGTQIAIFRTRNGVLESVPGSHLQFHFDHTFDGTSVAFRAKFNNLDSDGIRTDLSGSMVHFVNRNTPLPTGGGVFNLSMEKPWINNGKVIFRGRDPLDAGTTAIWQYDGSQISLLTAIDQPIPGTNRYFRSLHDPSQDDNGVTAFKGDTVDPGTGAITSGVYKLANGIRSTVANFTTYIPGGSGQFERVDDPVINSGNVVFTGRGPNGQIGIYAEIAGQLGRIADRSTPIPEWTGTFSNSSTPSISGSNVVFIGRGVGTDGGQFTHRGIYAMGPDAVLKKVIDNQDSLDGKLVSDFSLGEQSLDGGDLYFVASFTDGTQGLYHVAALPVSDPPIADAGIDVAVPVGDDVSMSGANSTDDNTSTALLNYAWSVTSAPVGSTAVLDGADTVSPDFMPDMPGEYVIELVVTDQDGQLSAPDTMTIFAEITPAFVYERVFSGGYSSEYVRFNDGTYTQTSSSGNFSPTYFDNVGGIVGSRYSSDYYYDSSGTYTNNYSQSVSLLTGSIETVLAGRGDPVAGTTEYIDYLSNPSATGNSIAAYGRSSGPDSAGYGLYEIDDSGAVSILARAPVSVAGSQRTLSGLYLNYYTDSDTPIYTGYGPDCVRYRTSSWNYYYCIYYRGLFTFDGTDAVVIADNLTQVPGRTDYFEGFSSAASDELGNIYFQAYWYENGTFHRGLFKTDGVTIESVLEDFDEDWENGSFGNIKIVDGRLIFGGYRYTRGQTNALWWSNYEQGIYELDNGAVIPLLTGSNSYFNGQYVASAPDAWRFDVSGDVIVSSMYRYDNTSGSYDSENTSFWFENGLLRPLAEPGDTILGTTYNWIYLGGASRPMFGRSVMLSAYNYSDTEVVSTSTETTHRYESDQDVLVAHFDSDRDGIGDNNDNCPARPNPDQADLDLNGTGDVCEDSDLDGYLDSLDNCPFVPNDQSDGDQDGWGSACDVCPLIADDQSDVDGDGIGDACDTDNDQDGFDDVVDNCPTVFNPDQADLDLDDLGDSCDPDIDGDGIANAVDGFWDGVIFTDESTVDSDNFSDHALSGKSWGRISSRGGLVILVNDAPEAERGLMVSAISGTGQAQIKPCDFTGKDAKVKLQQGTDIEVTCGSIGVRTLTNFAQMELDDDVLVDIPQDTEARVIDIGNGSIAIESSPNSPLPVRAKLGSSIELTIPSASIAKVSEPVPGQYEIENATSSAEPISASINGVLYVYEPGDVGVPVMIDIKPGSSENTINLSSNGVVPVAVFSSDTFDATTIDPLSVSLASAPVRLKGKGTPQFSIGDYNSDDVDDIKVHIETDALELSENATGAILRALTYSGTAVLGEDVVRIVPE